MYLEILVDLECLFFLVNLWFQHYPERLEYHVCPDSPVGLECLGYLDYLGCLDCLGYLDYLDYLEYLESLDYLDYLELLENQNYLDYLGFR